MIDTSLFVARGADVRSFTKTRAIAASPAQVFAAFTRPSELATFFGAEHNVELAVGGPYEILFRAEDGAVLGSNGCQVLSWVPDRVLSFSWNAPPMYPEERELRTWVTILLAEAEDGCAVELIHCGFGEGGNWDGVFDYFDAAWGRVLDWLEARFSG